MTSHGLPDFQGSTRVPVARPVVIIAAVFLAAIAAWLSQGTIALGALGGPRVAALPYSIPALSIVVAAALAVAGLSRVSGTVTPLSLFGLLALPWLPLPIPAAVLATNRRDVSALSCPATVRQFHHTRRSSSRPHGEGSWEVCLASRVQSLESGSATIVPFLSNFGLRIADFGLRPADY